jgi:hypothetical protein
LADGVKIHGCTVHFVVPAMDEGPIIAQAAVAVRDSDTPDTLAARVLAQEHVIYPAALACVAEGRNRVSRDIIQSLRRQAPCARPLSAHRMIRAPRMKELDASRDVTLNYPSQAQEASSIGTDCPFPRECRRTIIVVHSTFSTESNRWIANLLTGLRPSRSGSAASSSRSAPGCTI